MKELIDYVWNMPMWIIAAALCFVASVIGVIFALIFRKLIAINNYRQKRINEMNAEFEKARERFQKAVDEY